MRNFSPNWESKMKFFHLIVVFALCAALGKTVKFQKKNPLEKFFLQLLQYLEKRKEKEKEKEEGHDQIAQGQTAQDHGAEKHVRLYEFSSKSR